MAAEALFDRGSSTLSPASEQAISDLMIQLAGFQQIDSLEIVGHDEDRGDAAGSQALSLERARAVADFLAAAYPGVPADVRGVGASAPVASNRTPTGRQLNRRVEIRAVAGSVLEVDGADVEIASTAPPVVPPAVEGGGPSAPFDRLLPFGHWVSFVPRGAGPSDAASNEWNAALPALRRAASDCPVPPTVELVGSSATDDMDHWFVSGEIENRLWESLGDVELDIVSVSPELFLESFDPRRYRAVDRVGEVTADPPGVFVLHSCAPDAAVSLPDGIPLSDLSRVLDGILGSTSAALGGVSDARSTRIALSTLQRENGRLTDFADLFERLPGAAREPMRRVVEGGSTRLRSLVDDALAVPDAAPVLDPVLSEMIDTLEGMATS